MAIGVDVFSVCCSACLCLHAWGCLFVCCLNSWGLMSLCLGLSVCCLNSLCMLSSCLKLSVCLLSEFVRCVVFMPEAVCLSAFWIREVCCLIWPVRSPLGVFIGFYGFDIGICVKEFVPADRGFSCMISACHLLLCWLVKWPEIPLILLTVKTHFTHTLCGWGVGEVCGRCGLSVPKFKAKLLIS